MTILSGKANSTRPSLVFLICPATDASPLILIVVGLHQCVMVVTSRPKDCFVNVM